MNISDCYKVGYVLKPHGLKGEVTLSLDPVFPAGDVKTLFLERDKRVVPYFVDAISIRGNKAFVKFEDVDTPEAAASISKVNVYLPKIDREESPPGAFYDDEVIGFAVVDAVGTSLGEVAEVIVAGANRLLAVVGDREILIPVNGPFITEVDRSKRRIAVDLPDGFLDI